MESAKTRKRLPRIARILKKYLPLIEKETALHVPFEERVRRKGECVRLLREELNRMEARRSAFTLVEMLVAVALVVIMMTLFATIFQIATTAMQTQKGMAENDQRVRLVLTRLRNDLNGTTNDANDPNRPYRTFRNLIPWGPDEDVGLTGPVGRTGYFYISENNPDDDTDDVLALTVQFPSISSDQFYGQASVVLPQVGSGDYGTPAGGALKPSAAAYPPAGSATVPVANAPQSGQAYWPNQPDFDDIQGIPNKVGNSQFAEVCYFLRCGTLYRRVLLIRQPPTLSTGMPTDGIPTDGTAALDFDTTYTSGNRAFWNDFDYAAFFNGTRVAFHGTGNVVSDSMTYSNLLGLSNPAYRFGWNVQTGANLGLPREYVTDASGNTFFVGRFTHGETSDLNFGYPASVTNQSYGNPLNQATSLQYDTSSGRVGYMNGANTTYFSGPRSGEDILMTNVLKFDIKVFDPAASFGPDGAPGVAGVDDNGDGFRDSPNIPVATSPITRQFIAGTDPVDFNELGWPGSDDGEFVDIGHNGATGLYSSAPLNVPATNKRTFPTAGAAQTRVYPYLRYSNPAANRNRFDTWAPSLDMDVDGIMDPPPFRPFYAGADGKPGVAGIDDDRINGTDDPGELGWPNSDDRPIPLTAIQIKITFYDPASNQVREMTLVQSLRYSP